MEKIVNLKYLEHQYQHGELVLLAEIGYEVKMDIVNTRFFVINQNNQLIYLDELTDDYFLV